MRAFGLGLLVFVGDSPALFLVLGGVFDWDRPLRFLISVFLGEIAGLVAYLAARDRVQRLR